MRSLFFVLVLVVSTSAIAQDPAQRQQNGTSAAGTPAEPRGGSCTVSSGATGLETVVDGGFEAGTPNPNWNEASTNFGTPICDVAGCGTGGGTGPNSGTFWTWFGGISAPETGSVDQIVTIPAGTAELSFWLETAVCDGAATDFVRASIDGTVVFEHTCGDGLIDPYAQQFVDVSAFADGGSYTLAFTSTIDGSDTSNFFIDDVSLCAVSGPVIPDDVQPVPAMNRYGLIVLALLVLGIGGLLVRRAL